MAVQNINVAKAYARRNELLNSVDGNAIEKIHVSLGNSKMGIIPSFSVLPLITCTNCGECSKHCYACKGTFNFSNVLKNQVENTYLMMHDVARVENELNEFLGGVNLYRYFRFNVSGDVFSIEYLEMIVRIAAHNPMTKFLVFTKNYDLFNTWLDENELPSNLTVVFSIWHNAKIDNRHNLPTAIVKLDDTTEIPQNAFHCDGDCANCLNCWNTEDGTARYFDLH